MKNLWKPMFLAPTDGTPICALFHDLSGIVDIRIFRDNDGNLTVCECRSLQETGFTVKQYAGWCDLPEVPSWMGSVSAAAVKVLEPDEGAA